MSESLPLTLVHKSPVLSRLVTFQYTSVMLIILAVTSGALTAPVIKPPEITAAPAAETPELKPAPAMVALQERGLEITPVFDAHGSLVEDDALQADLQAIFGVLTRHEVFAEIDFVAAEEDLAAFALKALKVHQYLVALGVPANALTVSAHTEEVPQPAGGVRVRIFREAER